MKAVKLLNASRTMAVDQDEYNNLDILDAMVDGSNCMFSVWEPAAEEVEALINGGKIQLGVMGGVHPPVMLFVQDHKCDVVSGDGPNEHNGGGGSTPE